jgi:cobalt-zinc-cadmium efflux system membrane fusion protein
VKKGAEVDIQVLAYPQTTFKGTVEWISGALDPVSRTAKVRCSIANPEGKLRPEMFGTATISVDPDKKLAIKRSALLLLGEQSVVFVATGTASSGEMRFERRPIAVDEMSGGDYVPLKAGVARNENVVVKGGVLLLGLL